MVFILLLILQFGWKAHDYDLLAAGRYITCTNDCFNLYRNYLVCYCSYNSLEPVHIGIFFYLNSILFRHLL